MFLRSLLLTPLLLPASAVAGPDFVGAYAPSNWVSTGITGGAADVDLGASTSQELVLYYDVDLGFPGPGVTFREAEYSAIADTDGEVTFDWDFTYDARIYLPQTELYFWVEGPGGRGEALIHSDYASFGSETVSGSSPILVVNAGYPFGVRMGGGNLDSESRISGELILTNFLVEGVDCNGVPGGGAVEDMCGTCDSNPNNDCERDCNGVWGGSAEQDMCGTCDSNPNNDCERDCGGVWGGSSVEDRCGTCDSNPNNDCEQDCSGAWGGSAYVDSCGDCVGGSTGLSPCSTTTPADTDTDTDSDTDADTDADTDSDTDADTDSDTDADTDADSDTDTDTDTDADADADTAAPDDTGALRPPGLDDTGPTAPVTYTRAGRSCACASTASPTSGDAHGLGALFLRRR